MSTSIVVTSTNDIVNIGAFKQQLNAHLDNANIILVETSKFCGKFYVAHLMMCLAKNPPNNSRIKAVIDLHEMTAMKDLLKLRTIVEI